MSPDRRLRRRGRRFPGERRHALRRTALAFSQQRGVDAAAALTTYALLALLPVALVLVSALALLTGSGRAIDTLLDTVGLVASPRTVGLLRAPLTQLTTIPAPGAALAIGLVLTLWAVSGWAMGYGRVLNTFYGVPEGRPEWRFRLAMVLLAVPLTAGVLVCAALLLATPQVVGPVADRLGVEPVLVVLLQVVKWPLLVAVLAAMLSALLRRSPNVLRRRLGPVRRSALVTVGGCGIATGAFGLYLGTIAHYDAVYGWLGGALALLVWLFLMDVVLVYGAALDAELVRLHRLRAGSAAERSIRAPLRDTRRVTAAAGALRRVEAAGTAIRRRHAQAVRDAGPDALPGGYRGGMSRKEPEGTPSLDEVEHDFDMPDDPDLRPVDEDGEVEQQ